MYTIRESLSHRHNIYLHAIKMDGEIELKSEKYPTILYDGLCLLFVRCTQLRSIKKKITNVCFWVQEGDQDCLNSQDFLSPQISRPRKVGKFKIQSGFRSDLGVCVDSTMLNQMEELQHFSKPSSHIRTLHGYDKCLSLHSTENELLIMERQIAFPIEFCHFSFQSNIHTVERQEIFQS